MINQVLDPGIIWVKADSPYKSLKELLEAAKRTPNKISAATTGILSDDHLAIFLEHLTKPVAVTLHTVPPQPEPWARETIRMAS